MAHAKARLDLYGRRLLVERVVTDGRPVAHVARELGISRRCAHGKVERYNRTLQTEWVYRRVFTTNTDRTHALAPWLRFHNTGRRRSALGGQPPASRPS